MILENEALALETDYNIYTEEALNIYKQFNPECFRNFSSTKIFKDVIDTILFLHNQNIKVTYSDCTRPTFSKNNKVLVCCSGGLDSVYQALRLRELGYKVTLLHIDNCNRYTNGQEKKAFLEFAEKFNFSYYMPKLKVKTSSTWKKFWPENSFKTTLIYTIAVDYMLSLGIYYLSSGDDMRLTANKQCLGTNTGDCREITSAFIHAFGVDFIPVDAQVNKALRLRYLSASGARDYFYSTTTPGRLVEALHKKYAEKYNMHLDRYNAATDRKDCMHLLLDNYYNSMPLPAELEKRCWKILGDKASADYVFFNNELPLEERVKNLIEY